MKQVFSFAPASGFPANLIVALIGVPILAIVGYLISAPRLIRFEVSPEGLRIRGDFFYGRTIPVSRLEMEKARAIDFDSSPEYKPVLRTNGTGLPGYQAGWFRLRNGEKALVFVGDRRRVVVIPVRDGYSLLLSVLDADEFLSALRRV